MPELPEVEVTRQGLLPSVVGCRVTDITCSGKRLRLPLPRKLLREHIRGGTIITVNRRAKYLLFRMNNGSTMVMHLGMTGKLSLIPSGQACAVHDHLRLQLDSGMDLRFNDARRFGCIIVWPQPEAEKLEADFSAQIGVEPFAGQFNTSYLRRKSRFRKTAVKNFLMDSRIIAGIGNIYANEILFAAGIHPQTSAGQLTAGEWQKIIRATRRILDQAIQAGGSTISDFLGANGNPGYFQIHFNVYNRRGGPCRRCENTIEKTVIAGRATYSCPHCQPLSNEK